MEGKGKHPQAGKEANLTNNVEPKEAEETEPVYFVNKPKQLEVKRCVRKELDDESSREREWLIGAQRTLISRMIKSEIEMRTQETLNNSIRESSEELLTAECRQLDACKLSKAATVFMGLQTAQGTSNLKVQDAKENDGRPLIEDANMDEAELPMG